MPALHALHGTLPSAVTMGVVGLAALFANGAVFGLLWAYRQGDANIHGITHRVANNGVWAMNTPSITMALRQLKNNVLLDVIEVVDG